MTTLNKALTTDKINRLMSAALIELTSRNARTNEIASVQSNDNNLQFKLIGFNPGYQRVIVEVLINKLSVGKVIADKVETGYRAQTHIGYAANYLKALHAVPAKNTPILS